MALSLAKNEKLSLTKSAPLLKNARIGLGWDVRTTFGTDFDLDATALLLGKNGRVRSDADIVFYNQLTDNSDNPSVTHFGDNLTGEGDGDDEEILVALDKVPLDVQTILILVTIHDAQARGQNFGQVSEAHVRLVNHDTELEIANFDLSESAPTDIGLKFVALEREANGWSFNAIGQGTNGDFGTILREYGVNV